MKKVLLLSTALLVTIALMSQDCSDLFFSEYLEGSGNNKGLEIYNPTNKTIDLSKYWVARYSNGSTKYDNGGITQLEGFILPHSTFLLVNGQTYSTETSPACNPALQEMADMLDGAYPSPTYMNGNDAIALLKAEDKVLENAVAVDLFGQIGLLSQIEEETGWSNIKDTTVSYHVDSVTITEGKVINYIVQYYDINGQNFGPYWLAWTKDHSLIRKASVKQGVKENPGTFIVTQEWDTLSSKKDDWSNLNQHICDCATSSVIGEPGQTGRIQIYPNPVRNGTLVAYTSHAVSSLEIINITGKVIHKVSMDADLRKVLVPVDDLEPGVYLIKAKSLNSNHSLTEKFLIQ
jgi:hypothetical protein